MAYITEEDFEESFGRSELDDLLGGGSDFARVAEGAASLIDGYLSSRYALPLVSTPEIVKAWSLDIARFRLWDERAPTEVRRRYDDALAQLRDLSAGRLALPPDAAGTPTASPTAFGAYSADRIFTSDSLSEF